MLLRSVTKHVSDQNWFAVAIDLVIVVVGVFIGIQVSNWNDDRVAAQDSREFTERLREDLKEEAWLFEYVIEYYDDVLDNAVKTDDALEGRISLSDPELLVAAYRATQFTLIIRRRSTYNELVSTGRMELIKDEKLRDAAMRVYDMQIYDLFEKLGESSHYRNEFRRLISLPVQTAISESCGDKFVPFNDYNAIVDSLDYPCDPNIDADSIGAEAAKLRENNELRAQLRLRTVQLHNTRSTLIYANQDIRQALQAIAGLRAAAQP